MISGVAVDGYILGATVFGDANENGVLDPGEASAITDSSGNFTLTDAVGPLVVTGGIDISTGAAFVGQLRAPEGATTITSLSTLTANLMDTGMSLEDAERQIANDFSLGETADFLNTDPVAETLENSPEGEAIMAALTGVQNRAIQIGAMVSGSGAVDIDAATALTFNQIASASGEGELDLSDPATIEALILGIAAAAGLPSDELDLVSSGAALVIAQTNQAVAGLQAGDATETEFLTDLAQVNVVAQEQIAEQLSEAVSEGTTEAIDAIVDAYTGQTLLDAIEEVEEEVGDVDGGIEGTSGNDVITGTINSEAISGLDGDDTIIGVSGSDLLVGGSGSDSLSGEAGNDALVGELGDDTLDGADGDDDLSGGAGTDCLIGGDGNDTLRGGEGYDDLNGGNGDDELHSGDDGGYLRRGSGRDQLNGGEGTDYLSDGGGYDTVLGGAGHDNLSIEAYLSANIDEVIVVHDHADAGTGDDTITVNISLEEYDDSWIFIDDEENSEPSLPGEVDYTLSALGGEWNDRLEAMSGSTDFGTPDVTLTFDGGLGNDEIDLRNLYVSTGDVSAIGGEGMDTISVAGSFAITVDAGAGDDTVNIFQPGTAHVVTLGGGQDRLNLEFNSSYLSGTALIVTDFASGVGGDLIGLDGITNMVLSGWDGNSNPFGAGYLRVVQNGAGIVLEVDSSGSGANYVPLVVFQSTTAEDFTSDNFSPPFPPDGSGITGSVIDGTAESETLPGTIGDGTINGLDGDDIFEGGHGNDQLIGGAGNDVLEGGLGRDYLTGGDGSDTFVFEVRRGNDAITDFEHGIDVGDFSDYGFTDFTEVLDAAINDGTNVIVQLDAHTQLVLESTQVGSLLSDDFLL